MGWLVDFPNCCTSYPIPLLLVAYRGGKIAGRFQALKLPPILVRWDFVNGGRQVAYYADVLHGRSDPFCELRDVQSGRLIARWTPRSKKMPAWASRLHPGL